MRWIRLSRSGRAAAASTLILLFVGIGHSGCASLSDAEGATVKQAASPTAAAGPAARGLPARGTRWRYRYREEQFKSAERIYTVEVIGVQGSKVHERFAVEGGEIVETVIDGDKMRFIARTVSGTNAVVELAPYAAALYDRHVGVPSGYPDALGMIWRIEQPEYAEESVSVPAGTFSALRVRIEGRSPQHGAPYATSRFIYTAWYSKDLKRCIKIRHQTWTAWGHPLGDEVVQLISYEPPK